LKACVPITPVSGQVNVEITIEDSLQDCSWQDFPANVIWGQVPAFFAGCKVFTTKRTDVRTMSAFVAYLRHEDADNRPVTSEECQLLQRYYFYLKKCAECETTDCRDCERLVRLNEEDAEDLVRVKRFRLD
jgi:hypothetical protein